MRWERKEKQFASMLEGPAAKKRRLGHSKTKGQVHHLSLQLVDWSTSWTQKAKQLLSRCGHGISSMFEIWIAGRRGQDKTNIDIQVALEAARAANFTCEIITCTMVMEEATVTELSNDRVMWLGD